MPTFCGITTHLISQFDIKLFPEFAPIPIANRSNNQQASKPLDSDIVLRDGNIISVYTAKYPASQFWLSYKIEPRPSTALCYFKLYINKDCVVSWGCGEREGYQGQTQFGLFDSGECWMGMNGVEKRVLSFARDDGRDRELSAAEQNTKDDGGPSEDVVEIRVFRARGRKRTKVEVVTMTDSLLKRGSLESVHEGGIRLVPGGNIESGHPQRYYKYALIDPIDEPYAIFRYHFRTWNQLYELGIIGEGTNVFSKHPSPKTPNDKQDDSLSQISLTTENQEVLEWQPCAENVHDSPSPPTTNEADSPDVSDDSSSIASSSSEASVTARTPTKHRAPTPIPSHLPNPPAPSPMPDLPGSFPLTSSTPFLAPPERPRSFSPFSWLRRAASPDRRASSPFSRDPSPALGDHTLLKREKSHSSMRAASDVDESAESDQKERKEISRASMLKGIVASARRRKGDDR